MNKDILQAGAAQRVITPRVGVAMAGWDIRATGDRISRSVHDDLYVKALVLRRGDEALALLATDLVGIDAVATGEIREGIAGRTGLRPDAIMVTATHCHSGPVVCTVGSATAPEERGRRTVQADGSMTVTYAGQKPVSSTCYYSGETDAEWRAWFVAQAIEAGVEAWGSLRPAEDGFGEAEVRGVGSSRRVLMSDNSWGDPRRDPEPGLEVVSRSEIDPAVRVLLVRDADSKAPLSAVLNYGSHPWVFSIPGFSAEVAGATATRVAGHWTSSDGPRPIVLFTVGPEGDVTFIWNVDIENVWKSRDGEDPDEDLARRERGFDSELDRLSSRLADGVVAAIADVRGWDLEPELQARRREVLLPFKEGYTPTSDIVLADWQRTAPQGHHLTEVQVLQVGEGAMLSLPGEPFASLGKAIRTDSPFRHLVIAALGNEFGAVSYIGTREEYKLGGYELTHTAIAPPAGEVLVQEAIALLKNQE